ATKNNYFDSYNQKGPLYIFITRGSSAKFQLHLQTDSFTDESDRPVRVTEIIGSFPWIGEALKHVLDLSKPTDAYWYALNVIGRPWPEGEPIIAGSSETAYKYAKNVIKGPFSMGEEAISSSPYYSVFYSMNVIREKFPKGEATIA